MLLFVVFIGYSGFLHRKVREYRTGPRVTVCPGVPFQQYVLVLLVVVVVVVVVADDAAAEEEDAMVSGVVR